MDKKQNIFNLACGQNACTDGIEKFMESKTEEDLFANLYRYIDFCLVKDVPNKDFLKTNFLDITLRKNGVFINQHAKAENLRRSVAMGDSEIELNYNSFSVGRVYAADNSTVTINADENAYVIIDGVDNAKIIVNAMDKARVIVNAYSDVEVSGNATKINRKSTHTYELQAR